MITAIHVYFALAAVLGLIWFGHGIKIVALQTARLGGRTWTGLSALIMGGATALAGGLFLNYGIVNLLSAPESITSGLVQIGLLVALIQVAGLALTDLIEVIQQLIDRWL